MFDEEWKFSEVTRSVIVVVFREDGSEIAMLTRTYTDRGDLLEAIVEIFSDIPYPIRAFDKIEKAYNYIRACDHVAACLKEASSC